MNNRKITDFSSEAKVSVLNLNYNIASKQIIDNISIKVLNNQFVGVVGPNGSGKTTLLKHIYRVLPVDKNTVFLNGVDIDNYSFRDSAKTITVMRQENSSDFEYTVMEMVLMGRSPHKRFFENNSHSDIEIAEESLLKLGMSDYADRLFSTLSGGEKQRVLIARSLTQEADILILDEPTNHLDIHYQWALMDIIKNLGKTVVSVFHELNLACTFCDYIYVVDKGKIVAHGKPSEILTSDLLAEVFRIRADINICSEGIPHIIYKKALTGGCENTA